MDKTDARTLPIEALNERRRRAVKMRLDGVGVDETARCCELARGTVIAAHKAYRRGGWPAVEVARSGRPAGSGRRLSAAQEAEVRHLVCAHTPDQLGLDCALWSRAAVVELIRVRCGIALPVRTMGLYLARWGLDASKATAARHRAVARGGAALARCRLPGHRCAGACRARRDPLGRRDGPQK